MERQEPASGNDAANGAGTDQQYAVDYRELRTWIGGIAASLVIVVYLGNWAIFSHHVLACLVPGSHLPGSLSGYYYTHMRNVFVGAMCAMGVFFVAYKGFDCREKWFTNVAGYAAIGIAFCPTTPPQGHVLAASNPCGPVSPVGYVPSRYAADLGHAHAFFLTVLFTMVFLMLRRFTRTDPGQTPGRRHSTRSRVYQVCAGLIAADGLIVLAMTVVTHFAPSVLRGSTWLLYAEVVAFAVFAFGWLVKGRAGFLWFLRD
jgi:hypothetical protein